MSREARRRRGAHGDAEGGTGTSRGTRGRRGRHGDVERPTETPRDPRRRRAILVKLLLRDKPLARRARGLIMREKVGDAERPTATPSDFGQAFAQGQAPRPLGEGLDHERKGCVYLVELFSQPPS